VSELVPLKSVLRVPVEVHTHATAGLASMTYIKAVEAGADIIDTAISPLSGGTSQPATESIVRAFQGTERETGFDLELLKEIAEYFKPIRAKYLQEGILNPQALMTEPSIVEYQLPGGMLSNFLSQLKMQKAEHKYEDVLREIPRVRADLGYPPLVTPLSQMVGTQAIFNILTGVYNASSGEYTLDGENVIKTSTSALVKKGLARTFQNIRLFKYLSVLDNVVAAYNFRMKYGILSGMLRFPNFWREEKEAKEKAMALLKIFDLDKYAEMHAGNLPYGEQRKLEIARAMATEPKILLLDEPAAGMNPKETEDLMNTIKLIRDKFGIAVLLIEHDMKLVLGICERLVVLNYGQILASGDPQEVINNPKVVEAYLGKEEDE